MPISAQTEIPIVYFKAHPELSLQALAVIIATGDL